MFSKGHRLAYDCLRCQRNLARQTSLLASASNVEPSRLRSLRHQSTAAALFDDSNNDVEQPVASPESQRPEAVKPKSKRNRKHRWFKPTPTAGLGGVQTLGSPSEIILLPDRDRRIPQSATGDDAPKQHLSEALEEEKIPVAWEQVKEHIDQTRPTSVKQSGQLDEQEWHQLRTTLRQQFTRNQLKRYLLETRVETGHEISEVLNRPKLALMIASRVWGYQLPERNSTGTGPTDAAENGRGNDITKRKVFKHGDHYLLLQRDHVNGFIGIGKATSTSLTLGENQTVKVSGSAEQVALALKQLDLCTVRSTEVSLEGFNDAFKAERKKDAFNALLESTSTDYAVALRTTRPSALNVKHLKKNEQAFSGVRRHFRSTAEAFAQSQLPSIVVTGRPNKIRLVPYYTVMPVPWSTNTHQWARASDTSSVEAQEGLDSQWPAIMKDFDHLLLSKTRRTPNDPRCELSVRFGINLHHVERMAVATEPTRTPDKSWFADEAPIVAQLLARQELYKQDPEPDPGDVPIASPLLARVLLKPVSLKSEAPTFEVYLYGANRSLGMRQGLIVARITAITDNNTSNMSLPALPVDISWARQIKQDIFAQRSPATSEYPALLQDIGKYLAAARKEKQEQPDFASFTEFLIPSPLFPTPASPEAVDPKRPLQEKVEYFLASADILDVKHYTIPYFTSSTSSTRPSPHQKHPATASMPHLPLLRYTTFHPQKVNTALQGTTAGSLGEHTSGFSTPGNPQQGSLGSTSSSGTQARQRHELSIVETPLLCNPARMSASIDDYRRASMVVAQKIARLGRELKMS